MQINFKSRQAARDHATKRKAHGKPAKVVDNGPDSTKRYGVSLKG